ncbi:MAG: 2-hydroxyacyl-CoA dehydratase family protein [Spirochaetaceae bacterium]|jgi:benzoyl-CoA reductase/2-hydroxyglutaryl-CoA dehydratase subunit BcrC/BadD/HgdB|nr:2-hydroxyacyl-CoA dehydratase family protein [Spirochaetaceae bacterium]
MTNSDRTAKWAEKAREEERREVASLRACLPHPEYHYFLDLLERGVSAGALFQRTGKPVVNLLCIQTPLELIHAAGFLPFKQFSGSYSGASFAGGLPALMCPMLQSLLGLMTMRAEDALGIWVLPTTCDWIVKFPEMLSMKGAVPKIHWVELPHLKETERGETLWREEVFRFKTFLETESGRKIRREALRESVLAYNRAADALSLLEEHRSAGRVPFIWFLAVTNSFFLDSPEHWTDAVLALVKTLDSKGEAGKTASARVFLAGSPIFFPGWKLPRLLEEAGLYVCGDDLCSSGRIFPGRVDLSDESLWGITAALAERYHHGCLCPTFADNDRRRNSIFSQKTKAVIYHILKGCHPCDIESYTLENALKARGYRFIRLETGYTAEDSRNLLTRLEAFKQSLEN